MVKKIAYGFGLAVVMILSITTPMLALGNYSAKITIANTGATSYPMLPVIMTMDNADLVSNNYLNADGLNSEIDLAGVKIPSMLTDSKTLYAMPVSANPFLSNPYFEISNAPVATSTAIIVGYSGYITTDDNAALELGNQFRISVSGYIDTTAGSNKDIFYKADAFRIYVSSAGNIRAAITHAGDVEDLALTAALSSGSHVLIVSADATVLAISIDGTATSVALAGNSVPDNANDIIWIRNNVMPYANYLKIGK